MSEQHQKFLKRLKDSPASVFTVARWFHDKGYSVRIPAIRMAPTAAEHLDYVDDGDLFVQKSDRPEIRIEIKSLLRAFSGAEDWEFNNMFVSNVKSVDRMDPFPEAFFVLSKDLKAAGIIRSYTRSKWNIVTTKVSNTGNVESNYACPIELVKFIKFGPN